jgi:Flp pilus assembly protein TadG
MIGRIRPNRGRRDEGASAVELALVLPILVLLLFGIIAFGIVFAQKLALSNAAREAARYGTVGLTSADRPTCAQITARVQSALNNTIAMTPANVSVSYSRGPAGTGTNPCSSPSNQPCMGSSPGDELTVTANYTSKLIIPLGPSSSSLPIAGQGVYKCEYQ